MTDDFFEIDFLAVETAKSGDAITLRYKVNGATRIHVVDGGYSETGETLVEHIKTYYGAPNHIENVVLTHPDGDHAGGLKTLLDSDEFQIGALWMNRPWLYAAELLPSFKNYTSVDRLAAKLKEIYSHTAELEEKALEKGIPIREAFQGAVIGAFTVLAPSKARYLSLVLDSPRTPETTEARASAMTAMLEGIMKAMATAKNLVKSAWGEETFSPNGTSRENEMSIIQYAYLSGKRIVLTGDAGREALEEAANYAPWVGLALPGVDRFQVPHHGSRRNVSTDILDRWLGERLPQRPAAGSTTFSAFISSAKADPDHPRKSVERAFHHRGAAVLATEGQSICTSGGSAPTRSGWVAIPGREYPEEQEE
jgi:beta-lactamase superfamily II metal-dependent hydrolase